MKTLILFALAGALALAGCTATDESADDPGGTTTNPGGSGEVSGTVGVVDPGEGNQTNQTNGTNSTS